MRTTLFDIAEALDAVGTSYNISGDVGSYSDNRKYMAVAVVILFGATEMFADGDLCHVAEELDLAKGETS